MGESVWSWSKTAASNATADSSIGWAEGQSPGSVNNSARSMMAAEAKRRDDQGGQLTLAGGTTAYTLTTNQGLATLADGVRIHAVVNATNTGASTLAVDSLTAKAIRKNDDRALVAGDMLANAHMIFQYDASANGAAGAWLIVEHVPRVVMQVFTSDGTYTPTAGMRYCIVEAVGGGGGGGSANGSVGGYFIGGGGGAGSYARKLLTAADVGASKAVDVGANGTGGAAGSNAGTAGADTTFGTTLVVGKGGAGGGFSVSGTQGAGGAGGVAGTGDVTIPGGSGVPGVSASILTYVGPGGVGGSNPLGAGSGGVITTTTTTGGTGGNYGGGGSGGAAYNTASDAAGGDGAPGVIVVTEFL